MIQADQTLPVLQLQLGTAINQLEHLHNKLDFANPAGTEFNIIFQMTALHFALNHGLHFTHGFKGSVIDIFTEHERPGHLQQLIPLFATSDNACLDPGITLPFTAMLT